MQAFEKVIRNMCVYMPAACSASSSVHLNILCTILIRFLGYGAWVERGPLSTITTANNKLWSFAMKYALYASPEKERRRTSNSTEHQTQNSVN